MAVPATKSGVTATRNDVPAGPYPYQCATTGPITPGTPVNMTPPVWARFVKFKLGKTADDGVPKDAVSFYVRIRYPGDATEAEVPAAMAANGVSFVDPDFWMEIAPISGLLLSVDCTVADHAVGLIYAENNEALGLIP